MRNRHFLFTGFLLCVACSSATEDSVPAYATFDSAGLEVVQTNLPIRENGGGWVASREPVLTISTHPTNPDQVLHWVRGAVRLSDGRFAVLSESAKTLMLFDPAGELMGTVGRDGSGPGEFRSPYQLTRLAGDTLVVSERGSTRVSWFSPSGDFLRQVTPDRNRLFTELPDTLQVGGSRFFAPGITLWEVGNLNTFRVGERWRDPSCFLVTGADARDPVILGWFPWYERFGISRQVGRWAFFGKKTYSAAGGNPLRVYIGDSGQFSVQAFSTDGKLVRIIRDAIPPDPITPEDLKWERWEVLDWAEGFGLQKEWLEFADAMPIPEEKPAFEQLIVDSQGYLWAKEYSSYKPDPLRYRIFSPDGKRVGTVMLPGRLIVQDIGFDYVLGIHRDSDYLETVQMYTLQRPDQ